jgi:hypothetical protein
MALAGLLSEFFKIKVGELRLALLTQGLELPTGPAFDGMTNKESYRCRLLQHSSQNLQDSAVEWIRMCFSWDKHYLAAMCAFFNLKPTAGAKQRSQKDKPAMQRALLVLGLEAITASLKARSIQTAPDASVLGPVPTYSESESFVVVVVGMWWTRSAKCKHPDTARMDQLAQMVAADVKVVALTCDPLPCSCVGPCARACNGSECAQPSEQQMLCDVRSPRIWSRGPRAHADTIGGRRTDLLIFDYFWSPDIYWKDGEKQGGGYGGDWVTKLTEFFSKSGSLALLPNDKVGMVRGMIEQMPIRIPWVKLLTTEDANTFHPLYMATESITERHPDGDILTGVDDPGHLGRTNATATDQYLDQHHPFVLFYNQSVHANASFACTRLKSLIA